MACVLTGAVQISHGHTLRTIKRDVSQSRWQIHQHGFCINVRSHRMRRKKVRDFSAPSEDRRSPSLSSEKVTEPFHPQTTSAEHSTLRFESPNAGGWLVNRRHWKHGQDRGNTATPGIPFSILNSCPKPKSWINSWRKCWLKLPRFLSFSH